MKPQTALGGKDFNLSLMGFFWGVGCEGRVNPLRILLDSASRWIYPTGIYPGEGKGGTAGIWGAEVVP